MNFVLTVTAVALFAAPILHAQAPAPAPQPTPPVAPATPATPAQPVPSAPAGAAPAPGTAPAPAKLKPLSSTEANAVNRILESMHFHIAMAKLALNQKDDKGLSDNGRKSHKELSDLFTPLANYAVSRDVKN